MRSTQMRFEMKPIRTKKDYEKALARIDKLWDAKPGTKAYDELELLRRMGICEERGSGIDKVVCQTEAF